MDSAVRKFPAKIPLRCIAKVSPNLIKYNSKHDLNCDENGNFARRKNSKNGVPDKITNSFLLIIRIGKSSSLLLPINAESM